MIRNLTCIVCPRGCSLCAEIENGKVIGVTGNGCPRGKTYAIDECTHPMRTITSTVRAKNGAIVPVKTNRTVPKERVMDCMKEINRVRIDLPIRIGDVILVDVLGTGADVVATANCD